ncbi:MAG: GTP-binding protein, partial [Bacteroidales bacterium]|nr:GTP-binding protein [Bacteroidales bacterium]
MQEKQIPVLLLTGYLGSGKTTLLNNILANRKGIKFAVIVNDIGEVNIDAELIEKGGIVGQGDDSLVALQNGCICCTLKMDLVNQLAELTSMHRFDYIVIEASGICEPAPIAQTICSLPQLAPVSVMGEMPYVDSIVTVVDALRMRDEFDGGAALEKEDIEDEDLERLVIEQLEFCNIVLLNKASEVSADELGKLRAIVKNINPEAKILECDYGNIDLDEIIYTGLFDFDRVATSATWINAIEGHHEDDDEDTEHDDH